MRKTKVLTIGGGGFIGSNLALALDKTDTYECAHADIWSAKLRIRFENKPFKFIETDIRTDDGKLDEIIADHDVVFNMASQASPSLYTKEPLSVAKLNLFNGYKVIDACVRHRKRLIHFSTSEVYGKSLGSDEPFREDETDCVTGPIGKQRWIYSSTKQMLDRIIHAHGMQDGLEYTIVRPFNVVGPLIDHVMKDRDDGYARVFAHFISALMKGQPLQLVDGGSARRTFIYIDDIVSALLAILDDPNKSKQQIFNIGHPANETTIRDLAHQMRDMYAAETGGAAKSEIVSVPGTIFYGPGFEDTDRRMPDISKMRSLGWTPKVGLEELLERTMSYTVKNKERLTQAALDAL